MTSTIDTAVIAPRLVVTAWWTGNSMLPKYATVQVIDRYPKIGAIRIRRSISGFEYTCMESEVTYDEPPNSAELEYREKLAPYVEAIGAGMSVDQMAKHFGQRASAIQSIWAAIKRRGLK